MCECDRKESICIFASPWVEWACGQRQERMEWKEGGEKEEEEEEEGRHYVKVYKEETRNL